VLPDPGAGVAGAWIRQQFAERGHWLEVAVLTFVLAKRPVARPGGFGGKTPGEIPGHFPWTGRRSAGEGFERLKVHVPPVTDHNSGPGRHARARRRFRQPDVARRVARSCRAHLLQHLCGSRTLPAREVARIRSNGRAACLVSHPRPSRAWTTEEIHSTRILAFTSPGPVPAAESVCEKRADWL
jgi:hypothetical protein